MGQGCDMIVSLYTLPEEEKLPEGLSIKRAFPADKERILSFVEDHFQKNWIYETEHALMQAVPRCFIVTEDHEVLGFACYDVSAKSFFGPIGIVPDRRGEGIGKALLLHTLYAMKADGYGYGIIGWVDEAASFYQKTVGARFIEGAKPENSVYQRMIRF